MERIDVLPDEVLLEIFGFYVDMGLSYGGKRETEAWQSLVHVCRRWRNLVLASPRHLRLQLYCTSGTPASNTLDIWPAFPLIVAGDMTLSPSTENIVVALGQSSRVCQVNLRLVGRQLEDVLAAMQVPFPELTDLQLFSFSQALPVIPDSFLGGSAPRLRLVTMSCIPFPGLPSLLLSATQLVHLKLSHIPHSGYFSPEAMVALLHALSNLETLSLEFVSPQSRPNLERRPPPPSKRSILTALNQIRFKGVPEYLEDLVTFIDAPQLNILHITFFNQIDFDFPRLVQFIDSTLTRGAHDEAHVQFNEINASVELRYRSSQSGFYNLLINISCREPDWQLSSIEQVCNLSLHSLSAVEDLYIEHHQYLQLDWKNDSIENTLWRQLLLPFTAVKNLYLFKEFAPSIASALQELVGARIMEVLPRLQNIFVEELQLVPSGPLQKNIEQFTQARRQSGHLIAVSVWDRRRP